MAIKVEPLFDSRQLVTDGRIKTSEIDFLVAADINEVLLPEDALYATGVPKVLFQDTTIVADKYPWDDELKVDSKSVKQRLNENTYIINVKYSNNNKFSFSSRELNTSVAFSTSIEELSIPFATFDNIVYPPVQQGAIPSPVTRWQTREYKVKAVIIDLRVTCQFDDLQANTHVDYIASQIGNWHKLGMRNQDGSDPRDYWRFMGGNATSVELVPMPNGTNADGQVYRYNLEYSWRQRKTIKKLETSQWTGYNPSNILLYTADITQFDTVAVRPPQAVTGSPTLYNITSKPSPRNLDDENGWRYLPGYPLGR